MSLDRDRKQAAYAHQIARDEMNEQTKEWINFYIQDGRTGAVMDCSKPSEVATIFHRELHKLFESEIKRSAFALPKKFRWLVCGYNISGGTMQVSTHPFTTKRDACEYIGISSRGCQFMISLAEARGSAEQGPAYRLDFKQFLRQVISHEPRPRPQAGRPGRPHLPSAGGRPGPDQEGPGAGQG